jgi:fructosamine-3-kinase
MPYETRVLRENAPRYIVSLIEDACVLENITSLEDLPTGSLSVLAGGARSVAYSLANNETPLVIKFRSDNATTYEAESLQAWSRVKAPVPNVISEGVIPISQKEGQKVSYILLGSIVNNDGTIAEEGSAFLEKHPEAIDQFGRSMGRVLAAMHTARTDEAVGPLPQQSRSTSWTEFLHALYESNRTYLEKAGIGKQEQDEVIHAIGTIDFSQDTNVYLHTDWGPRNILVKNDNPETIVGIDPNPMVGHPLWDIAVLANYVAVKREKIRLSPHNHTFRADLEREERLFTHFLKGYQQDSDTPISPDKLSINQLGQMFIQLRIREQIAKDTEYEAMLMVVQKLAASLPTSNF